MKVVANNSRTTVQLIEIELSKAYLYRALRCKDSESDSIYCLANVYLAVLYYTTGQYQKAIDHCTVVTRSRDHSQSSSHVVQGELVPKIDDDIDSVLGLAVFYQYVRTAALNQQQQTQYMRVFSTELFAHYLLIRCQSVVKCRRFTADDDIQPCAKYVNYVLDMKQPSTADMLLLKLIRFPSNRNHKPQTKQRQTLPIKAAELDTSELVELLQRSAVEHLTAFRQLTARDLPSIVMIVSTDFEALYAYKRGDYRRCLQLCKRNLGTLLYALHMHNVSTFPEFVQLLDDEIVSLIALTLIIDPDCRNFRKDHIYSASIMTQLTLSLYLMTQCQLKLRHSVMSLTRTLDYIEVAQRGCPLRKTFDQLTLKLTKRKIMIYLSSIPRC